MPRVMLVLVACLLAACAGETVYVAPVDVDDSWIRDEAAAAWASVGVEAPSAYTLLFLDPATLADACGAGDLAPGTQLGGCTPETDVVLLNAENSPAQQVENLVHELGHILRGGDGAHLPCGAEADRGAAFGGDVMCLSGAGPSGAPTARDAAFVTR